MILIQEDISLYYDRVFTICLKSFKTQALFIIFEAMSMFERLFENLTSAKQKFY